MPGGGERQSSQSTGLGDIPSLPTNDGSKYSLLPPRDGLRTVTLCSGGPGLSMEEQEEWSKNWAWSSESSVEERVEGLYEQGEVKII